MQHFISSFWSWEAKDLALINSSGSGKASQGNVEGHFPYTKYIYFTIVKAPFHLCFNVMDYCMKPMRGAMSDNFMSTLKLLEQADKKYKSFLCQHSTNSMSTWLDHDVLH